MTSGRRFVLTGDRTLMARHRLLLDAMFASSQTTAAPHALVSALMLPRNPHVEGRAAVAPLGLRRLQAALLAGGCTPDHIAVADEFHLDAVIGPDTRLIGVSTGEPLGLGMSSSTMVTGLGGAIYPQAMFERLMARVRELRARAPQAQVVLGGPGAWQTASDRAARQRLRVDCVVSGYAESVVGDLARRAMAGETLPETVTADCPLAAEIPPISEPAGLGAVELSRGCGLGCRFCTLADLGMRHLPAETILADAETNLRGGQSNLSLLSEDLLRYGASGLSCSPGAVIDLLTRLRGLLGVRLLQADHVNVASLARYSDAELAEIHRLLTGGLQRWPWFNLGVETASGQLLARTGGRPKMGGVAPEEWGSFCEAQVRRLMALDFVPMVSLVLGLPGETEADLAQTGEWVRRLSGQRVMIFPLIYAPVAPDETPPVLSARHVELWRECYEFNFRQVPVVYDDSLRAGGDSLGRRLAIQALGYGNVLLWRRSLAAQLRRATGSTRGGA